MKLFINTKNINNRGIVLDLDDLNIKYSDNKNYYRYYYIDQISKKPVISITIIPEEINLEFFLLNNNGREIRIATIYTKLDYKGNDFNTVFLNDSYDTRLVRVYYNNKLNKHDYLDENILKIMNSIIKKIFISGYKINKKRGYRINKAPDTSRIKEYVKYIFELYNANKYLHEKWELDMRPINEKEIKKMEMYHQLT